MYVETGGIPIIYKEPLEVRSEYLEELANEVYLKDIMEENVLKTLEH